MSTVRIGIDTGGTFTDFVLLKDGQLHVHKLQSTPKDPSRAVAVGLQQLTPAAATREIVHGSTVATNAVLERKGARLALVTTRGFEDLLLIGRQTRPALYDVFVKAPVPLVNREWTYGLSERTLHDGTVLRPLERREIDALVQKLAAIQPDAVVLCLLHSYANPTHERVVADHLAKAGFAVCASHEILSEYREFERGSTTALNAYVMPLMATYLGRLEACVGEDRLTIMQSNGGTISAELAGKAAIRTVLSGPAGGVIGAVGVGNAAGFDRLITFDMGGTSTDVSLVDRHLTFTAESMIGDFPVRLPMLDIHTVGAGGGSIAYLDAGGAIRVGPASAGADPGPACYGSGDDMTVTDANVVLGRIVSDRFLGGRMPIFPERAWQAAAALAASAALEPIDLAEGIVEIANSNMERAIRVVSVERGHDPRDFALVPFGGAGGLHACDIADRLEMRTIVVPRHAGVLSALGLLLSDTICDFSQTVLWPMDAINEERLASVIGSLDAKALDRLQHDGFLKEQVRLEHSADVRYAGQSYEINVTLEPGTSGHADTIGGLSQAFHEAHERLYGYADPARSLQLVNLRVQGIGRTDKPDISRPAAERSVGTVGHHRVYCGASEQVVPVFNRGQFQEGEEFEGPALVIDEGSTTWVAPRWAAHVDHIGNLILTKITLR